MYHLGHHSPRSFQEVALTWPFETFMSSVLLLGSALTVLPYTVPIPAIWVDMGPLWALAWLIMAFIAGALLVIGLWRDDLSALGSGLIMGGCLLGGYLLVATFNDSVYPSVLSQALFSMTALTSLSRGVYFQWVVGHARRRREYNTHLGR